MELPDTGEVVLHSRYGEVRLPGRSGPLSEALRRMTFGPVSLNNIVADFPPYDAPQGGARTGPDAAHLHAALEAIQHLVVRSLSLGGMPPFLSAVPIARQARFRPRRHPADHLHRLSRFTMLRTDGGGLRLESPLSVHRVEVHRPEVALVLGCLGSAVTVEGIAAQVPLPLDAVQAVLAYLIAADMVTSATRAGRRFAEDTDPALTTWSPIDLMLHTRSRLGRHDEPLGAACSLLERPEPGPKPLPAGLRIRLPHPELDQLLAADAPFTAVLEARRSVRSFEEGSLTAQQLGEVLYRVARLRSPGPPEAGGEREGRGAAPPAGDRPYPSTGSAYALELYLTVHDCVGLARGVYLYVPQEHSLIRITSAPEAVDAMLESAQMAADLPGPPPVLITITACFDRMTRKYDGLAYSSLLKDVGALQQTLYLVCTGMGLAPCAVATGDIAQSSEVFGLDWRAESSLGEFVLGATRRADRPAAPPDDPGGAHGWWERCSRVVQQSLARTHRRPLLTSGRGLRS